MATISITIQDLQLTRVVDAVALVYGYQAMIVNPVDPGGPLIPNPQTKGQFAKATVAKFVHNVVKQAEAAAAAEVARAAASIAVDTEVTIT